ncbi:MAG: hypothetical protein J6L81_10030 [Clostridia bacterium]|nr:hypothetical protein [Clostridia bacterium]
MKKRFILILFTLFAVFFCPVITYASQQEDIYAQQYDASGADMLDDALPEDTAEYMETADIGNPQESIGEGLDIKKIFVSIADMLEDSLSQPLFSCAGALMISLLCSLCACTWKGTAPTINCIGGLMCSLTCALPIVDFIGECGDVIGASCDFSSVFVPVYAAILTVNGHPLTSAGFSSFALMLNEICTVMVSGVILPLLNIYLAVSLVVSIGNDSSLERISDFAGKSVKWFFGFSAALLAGISVLSTVSTGAADKVTYKATRYLISNCLPIVGGSISDAASVVQGSMGVLKLSVGSFAIIAIAYIFLPHIIKAAVWLVFSNISAAFAQMLGAKNTAAIYKSTASVLSMLLSLLVFTSFLMIISAAMTLGQGTG